jgi:hypothetical protein
MNPAMSSWVALRQRVPFRAGQHVLVLGATGNAGQLAVQVARHLGANQVIAAGRNAGRLAGLPALGATSTVLLDGDAAASDRLGQAAAGADVVIDYLWGEPTTAAMAAVVGGRADRGQPLTWIEIGRWPDPARRSPPPRSAPPASRSWAAGKAQSAPGRPSPNCPPSPGRSPREAS